MGTTCNVGHVGLIAEEQDFFAAGLRNLFVRKLSFASVHHAKSLAETLDSLMQLPPVALVTISAALPGMNGTDTIRELRRKFPNTRIAVMAQSAGRETILAALAAGAHGFVPKSLDAAGILLALRVIMSGQIYVPAILAEHRGEAEVRARSEVNSSLNALTRRQLEIIGLMADGKSNKLIARILGISPSTVKVHLHAAFRTLGVHSRTGALSACRADSWSAEYGALIERPTRMLESNSVTRML